MLNVLRICVTVFSESEGEEMGNAEGCCGLRSSDQVHENDSSSMYNREKRKFIVRLFINSSVRV